VGELEKIPFPHGVLSPQEREIQRKEIAMARKLKVSRKGQDALCSLHMYKLHAFYAANAAANELKRRIQSEEDFNDFNVFAERQKAELAAGIERIGQVTEQTIVGIVDDYYPDR
jgi:hypothetical protein